MKNRAATMEWTAVNRSAARRGLASAAFEEIRMRRAAGVGGRKRKLGTGPRR